MAARIPYFREIQVHLEDVPGLTWLLLHSAVPAISAAALPHVRPQLAGSHRVLVAKPGGMPPGRISQDGKRDESLEKYHEDAAIPRLRNFNSEHGFVSNVFDPDGWEDGRVMEKDDSRRLKRQLVLPPNTTTFSSTPESTTTMKSPAPPRDAVVETRPDLIHPAFTTYLFSVTVPCVIAWVIVTWLCLWICRPHSPLYREILKRLIEHSQMKQKSVLFAATVLAGERKPPEDGLQATDSTSPTT